MSEDLEMQQRRLKARNALDDLSGMEREACLAKELGFSGKGAIHPKQIPILNQVFTPSESEIAHAQKILHAFEAADTGLVVVDGKLIEKTGDSRDATSLVDCRSYDTLNAPLNWKIDRVPLGHFESNDCNFWSVSDRTSGSTSWLVLASIPATRTSRPIFGPTDTPQAPMIRFLRK